MKVFLNLGTNEKAQQFLAKKTKGITVLSHYNHEVKVEWNTKALKYERLLAIVRFFGGDILLAD